MYSNRNYETDKKPYRWRCQPSIDQDDVVTGLLVQKNRIRIFGKSGDSLRYTYSNILSQATSGRVESVAERGAGACEGVCL